MKNPKVKVIPPVAVIKVIIVFFSFCFLHGCVGVAVSPTPPRSQYPHHTDTRTEAPKELQSTQVPAVGPAGSLYDKAEVSASQGNYEQAELSMERALRVEPTNGYYWYKLAEIKFKRKQYSQAVQLCLKSKSLAGSDRKLIQSNDTLIQRIQNSTR